VQGREVRTLVDGPREAGPHEVVWEGSDDAGRRFSAGVYWVRMTAGDWSSNRKMVVLQ
jgi:hypothetical protein